MRHGGWTAWAFLTFALTACGRTQSAPGAGLANGAGGSSETPSSPERLVAWQLEAEGTEPLVVGVFDTEQQTHCRFVPDSNGQLRCLPLTPGGLESTLHFADPECRQPVYRSQLPAARAVLMAAARPFTVPLPPDGCEQRYAVGTLTEVDTSAARYFRSNTSCTPTGALDGLEPNLRDSVRDFKLAEVIPATRYVSGREVTGAVIGGRVRLRHLETPGGFSIVRSLFDERWQKPCRLATSADKLSCLPDALPDSTHYFVESSCTGQNLWLAEACVEPAYIGMTGELYAIGEPWIGPVFEYGKVCHERDLPTVNGNPFVTRGEPLGPDATATSAWAQAGTGRLGLRGLLGDEGERVVLSDEAFDSSSLRSRRGEFHTPRYHDSQQGVDCSPVWTSDGEVRCAPSTALIDPYTYFFYVDDACREPAYFCAGQGDCEGIDMVMMDYDENGEFRAVSRNKALAIEGDVFAQLGTDCVPQGMGGMMLLRMGEPLPWDDYALLSEVNGRASGEP